MKSIGYYSLTTHETKRPQPTSSETWAFFGHGCERSFSPATRMKMKRKKWSEQEELTLLSKYSDLLTSGALAKLKTREKKFRPIADHVNSEYHLQDSLIYPFRWTWRDVSIKVQNMRHQYLGVKQKIKLSEDDFDWKDGENHWQNFLKYKEVFGDVPLDVKGKKIYGSGIGGFGGCGDLGFESDDLDEDEDEYEGEDGEDVHGEEGREEDEEEDADDEGEDEEEDGSGEGGFSRNRKLKKGFGISGKLRLISVQVLELKNMMMKREEERREMEFRREKGDIEKAMKRKEAEFRKEKRMNEREQWVENREAELEKRELKWASSEFESQIRSERELGEERRKRMKMEEKREGEEMEWRMRMIELQIDHEKHMMQMHAEACQNQMQILGVMGRLFCQFFGSSNDGLGGGLGALHPQVLQNLQDPGGLDDSEKPDANSPSEFL